MPDKDDRLIFEAYDDDLNWRRPEREIIISHEFLEDSTKLNIYAHVDSTQVGYLDLYLDEVYATVSYTAVSSDSQRQGIAFQLYQRAIEELTKLGKHGLWGAITGKGIVELREKVFGPGNTKYYTIDPKSKDKTYYTADEAIDMVARGEGPLAISQFPPGVWWEIETK